MVKAGDRVTFRRGRTIDQSLPGMTAVHGGDLSGCAAMVVDDPDRRPGSASDGKEETRVHVAPTEGPNKGMLLDVPVDKLRRRALGGVVDDVRHASKRIVATVCGGSGRARRNYELAFGTDAEREERKRTGKSIEEIRAERVA